MPLQLYQSKFLNLSSRGNDKMPDLDWVDQETRNADFEGTFTLGLLRPYFSGRFVVLCSSIGANVGKGVKPQG